jgi:hypothetical protein
VSGGAGTYGGGTGGSNAGIGVDGAPNTGGGGGGGGNRVTNLAGTSGGSGFFSISFDSSVVLITP